MNDGPQPSDTGDLTVTSEAVFGTSLVVDLHIEGDVAAALASFRATVKRGRSSQGRSWAWRATEVLSDHGPGHDTEGDTL